MNEDFFKRCKAVRQDFAWHGASIAQWARDHNFSVALVYDVLNGRRACLRGNAHRVAIALGLKRGSTSHYAPGPDGPAGEGA